MCNIEDHTDVAFNWVTWRLIGLVWPDYQVRTKTTHSTKWTGPSKPGTAFENLSKQSRSPFEEEERRITIVKGEYEGTCRAVAHGLPAGTSIKMIEIISTHNYFEMKCTRAVPTVRIICSCCPLQKGSRYNEECTGLLSKLTTKVQTWAVCSFDVSIFHILSTPQGLAKDQLTRNKYWKKRISSTLPWFIRRLVYSSNLITERYCECCCVLA